MIVQLGGLFFRNIEAIGGLLIIAHTACMFMAIRYVVEFGGDYGLAGLRKTISDCLGILRVALRPWADVRGVQDTD